MDNGAGDDYEGDDGDVGDDDGDTGEVSDDDLFYFNYMYECVCLWISTRECKCPSNPEKCIRFPRVINCLMQVLRTKCRSSSRELHSLNH